MRGYYQNCQEINQKGYWIKGPFDQLFSTMQSFYRNLAFLISDSVTPWPTVSIPATFELVENVLLSTNALTLWLKKFWKFEGQGWKRSL